MNQDQKFLQLFQLAKAINAYKYFFVDIDYSGICESLELSIYSDKSGKFETICRQSAYLDNKFKFLDSPTLDQMIHVLQQILECIEVGRVPIQQTIEFGCDDVEVAA